MVRSSHVSLSLASNFIKHILLSFFSCCKWLLLSVQWRCCCCCIRSGSLRCCTGGSMLHTVHVSVCNVHQSQLRPRVCRVAGWLSLTHGNKWSGFSRLTRSTLPVDHTSERERERDTTHTHCWHSPMGHREALMFNGSGGSGVSWWTFFPRYRNVAVEVQHKSIGCCCGSRVLNAHHLDALEWASWII